MVSIQLLHGKCCKTLQVTVVQHIWPAQYIWPVLEIRLYWFEKLRFLSMIPFWVVKSVFTFFSALANMQKSSKIYRQHAVPDIYMHICKRNYERTCMWEADSGICIRQSTMHIYAFIRFAYIGAYAYWPTQVFFTTQRKELGARLLWRAKSNP